MNHQTAVYCPDCENERVAILSPAKPGYTDAAGKLIEHKEVICDNHNGRLTRQIHRVLPADQQEPCTSECQYFDPSYK
jgi:hypothetical protein